MSLIINTSPDISLLSVEVIYDLSGVSPAITLNNLSQGPNLAGVEYAFKVQSPTLTYIHDGNFSPADESGVWSQHILSDPWPRPYNNIEWGLYKFQVIAKDSTGTEYSAPVQTTKICRPNGNLPTSKNPYGLGEVTLKVICEQARIFFQDATNTSYQGITGTIGSAVLRVSFPMDNTGTVPTPFTASYFTSAMVPITYSGKGYQFLYYSIYEYDLGDQSFVRIKYVKNDVFGVWCGIDLMPLVCEMQKLIASIEDGSCADVEAAKHKQMLITPKLLLVLMGMQQPLIGVDVPALIEEIQEIGGFDCDCCNVASGVIPTGSSAFDGYTFEIVPTCGDIDGQVVVNGYNIQFELNDISYVFKICDESPLGTTAFTVIPSLDGCTKTYCLSVDIEQLAEDILNTIKTNQTLVNLFNSIVNNNGGNFNLIVDGKCIFTSGTTWDYEFHLEEIPEDTTFAIITGIALNTQDVALNYSFNMTGLAGLQAYLNTLGYGTFVVTASSPTTVTITVAASTTNIQALYYTNNSGPTEAGMDKTPSGFTQLTANQVVQNIIDYICDLCDTQIKTCAAYEICYIDENGDKQIQTIDEGESVADVLAALATRGCETIDYIVALGSVNCATIKSKFPSSIEVMQPTDYFLGTKNEDCAQILPVEAFLYMLTYGKYSQDVINAFCEMVELCKGGTPCAAYTEFYAALEVGSPDYDLVITFSHPAAVSNIIRYARIDNTTSPVYTSISGVLPGDSPYTISGVANGQYRIGITPVYSDGRACSETFYETLPCTGVNSFSAIFDGSNIIVDASFEAEILDAKVVINYPNGGQYSQIFTVVEGNLSETIAPPTGVYGTFYATISPVCDNDSGWIGEPTAPAAFEIEETSP